MKSKQCTSITHHLTRPSEDWGVELGGSAPARREPEFNPRTVKEVFQPNSLSMTSKTDCSAMSKTNVQASATWVVPQFNTGQERKCHKDAITWLTWITPGYYTIDKKHLENGPWQYIVTCPGNFTLFQIQKGKKASLFSSAESEIPLPRSCPSSPASPVTSGGFLCTVSLLSPSVSLCDWSAWKQNTNP